MKWLGILLLLLGIVLRWTTSISPVILWIIIIVGAILVIITRISRPKGV
jgi:hypothetical protein